MNTLFKPDRKIIDVLKEKKFTFSAEIIPPRNGAELGQVQGQIQALVDAGTEFIAVTKGAGGSLRGGSLPIAQIIKEQFQLPCIAHFTCRDLTAVDVENQLIDHHYFGVRNILALRGDPPDGQGEWKAREGGYEYAYQLMEQIRRLNRGEYLSRAGGPAVSQTAPTDFCIGAAVYPQAATSTERVDYFAAKVRAGAEYGMTDVLFDPEAYARFLDETAQIGIHIPVLPGTRVLRSQEQAARMMKKFKVTIPAEFMSRLPEKDGPDSLAIGLDLFAELTEKFIRYGAPGIHVFVIVDTAGSAAALKRLAVAQKEGKSFPPSPSDSFRAGVAK